MAVKVSPQEGLKACNKIKSLPGQPDRVDFDHYSGYVTVDENAVCSIISSSPRRMLRLNPLCCGLMEVNFQFSTALFLASSHES
jgi:hypothetical protein